MTFTILHVSCGTCGVGENLCVISRVAPFFILRLLSIIVIVIAPYTALLDKLRRKREGNKLLLLTAAISLRANM